MAKQAKKEEKQRSTLVKRTTSVANSRAKNRKNGGNKNQEGFFKRMKEYFKGVRLEMKKVVWPTKKELGSYTAVVLATCVAFALAFWAIDSGVLAAIRAICF